MEAEKIGLIGGAVGATVGGLSWLIILGIVLKSPLYTVLPILWGIVCIVAVVKLYAINPQRFCAIIGTAILWIMVLNIMLGNMLYESIPDTVGGMSTGKEQMSLLMINVFMALFLVPGFFLLVRDIVRKAEA